MNEEQFNQEMQAQAEKLAPIAAESCYNCVYSWFVGAAQMPQGEGAAPVVMLTGFCRRHPPIPIPIQEQQRASPIISGRPNGAQQPQQPVIHTTYAPTNSGQWCGDHMTVADYTDMKAAPIGDEEDELPGERAPDGH